MRITVRMFIVSLLAAATSLQAITYIVPSDRDLVKRAEAIVIATAVESHAEIRGERVVTVANLQVERVIKGSVSDVVQLVEIGGAAGERVTFIPGSPRYDVGVRYLVFLHSNTLGEWMTYGYGLGQFRFVSDLSGRELVARGGSGEEIFGLNEADGSFHVEQLRGASAFLSFVGSRTASEAPAREDYFVNPSEVIVTSFPEFKQHTSAFVPHVESTRPDYLSAGNFRWQNPSASFVYCCSAQTGGTGLDGPSGSSAAMAAWNAGGAGVAYSLSGSDPTATRGLSSPDNKNGVLFNDPDNVIGTSGAVAVGGVSSAIGTYSLGDGFTYFKTVEVDVVTGKNLPSFIGQSLYVQLLTHELGHTLGFRHSDQTAANDPSKPCDSSTSPCAPIGQAIMASTIQSPNSIGSLGQWDRDAVQTVYGSGPVCNAPAITGQPANVTITSGQQTTLTVTATGTTPTYQWYIGNPPSTTTIAPNGTGAQLTVAPTVTTTYWVKVSGCSTSVNSNAATVTVNPPPCTPPTAGTPTATPSSIQSGQSSTLSVTATGTGPLSYQWFTGSTPVGTGSSISVSPAVTTTYFVRVTGQCSPVSDSQTVTVTVATCVPASASTPNASPSSITAGQSSTLTANVSGTGPFTYQWFSGATLIGTTSSISVTPTVTTSYFVRVTGQCGSPSDSPTVTVTVASCVPPTAPTPNASPASIPAGQSSTISVNPSGTGPFTYQWFSGTPGNPTAIGTGQFIIVAPTVTTSYFVRVTGQCGSPSDSPAVTVTVTCSPIASGGLTAQPSTINSGQSSTLSFNTSGSGPFTIQWFTGQIGDLSQPLQATGTSTVVSPTVTTNYWVRVTAPCGSQDSAVTVFVSGPVCTAPSIITQPASTTTTPGTPVTLVAAASGTAPLTYQWYIGDKGDVSNLIAGATSASLTRSPTVTTKYWLRVTNSCNGQQSADSNAATVTVTSTCTNPSITTQPANVSTPTGSSATLKVVAAGTGLHYQWYQGSRGDTSQPTGTDSATLVTGGISTNTTFWVRVTGTCGSPADSNAATVTATAPPRSRAVRH